MTRSDDDVREPLVAAIDAELGDRLRTPLAPPAARSAHGRRRWAPAVAAAVVVAAVAGLAVLLAGRDDPAEPAGSGTGVRVVCTARSGAAADRDRLETRARDVSGDASVAIDGSVATITVPGASPADVSELCASSSFSLRPLIAPPADSVAGTPNTTPYSLPSTEAQYQALTANERSIITRALQREDCAKRAVSDAPTIACFDCECNVRSALLGPSLASSADIDGAEAVAPAAADNPASWTVAVRLDETGGQALSDYTSEHNSSDDESTGPDQCGPTLVPCADYLAIVVDDYIVSLPLVRAPLSSSTIQFDNSLDEDSARRLAVRLDGALPVPLTMTSVDPY